ncbi:hypothetical protein OC844_004409 [Tilletia horrida]|nr:hypothetical protein OC844_004409 [Tilletia horrida]
MSFLFSSLRRGPKDSALSACAAPTRVAPDTPASAAGAPPADAPAYDAIVVGAGTAGSVLAHRLSQDAATRVLVLERGTYMSDAVARIPLLSAARAFQAFYTTNIHTAPQPAFEGRTSVVQVGRMVGGSSAINATVYSRGSHCEFDAWTLDGWRGADLDKYFTKSERLHVEPDHAAPVSSSRGTEGPWQIRITKPVLGFNEPFLTACDNIGIVRTPDPHAFEDGTGPVATGAWSVQAAQTPDGSRHHAGFAYLPENVLRERANLKLCVDAGVERVQLSEQDGKLQVEGVWIVQKGKVYYARTKRVIIASGAIFSPCILQRSGLGPAPLLKSLSIPVLADLPGVGGHLTDHFLVPLHFSGPLQDSAYQMIRGAGALPTLVRNALTYWRTGRGLFATACTMESMSYFPTEEVEIVPASTDGAPGRIRLRTHDVRKHVPDVELTVSGVWADGKMPEYHGLGARGVVCFLVLLVKPESAGEVSITSTREADLPTIDPAYLQAEADMRALRTGIRVGMAVAAQMRHQIGYDLGPACVPGWEPLKGGWDADCLPTLATSGEEVKAKLTPDFDFVDPTKVPDATIDAFIRKHAFGAQHMSSTCRMGPASDPSAVLDPATLEVRGTSGLSVCDASIFPHVLSVHPSAAIVAAAEKYADELIKRSS